MTVNANERCTIIISRVYLGILMADLRMTVTVNATVNASLSGRDSYGIGNATLGRARDGVVLALLPLAAEKPRWLCCSRKTGSGSGNYLCTRL